jgi:hypothetical protein
MWHMDQPGQVVGDVDQPRPDRQNHLALKYGITYSKGSRQTPRQYEMYSRSTQTWPPEPPSVKIWH